MKLIKQDEFFISFSAKFSCKTKLFFFKIKLNAEKNGRGLYKRGYINKPSAKQNKKGVIKNERK
jgi:hypothetical protein